MSPSRDTAPGSTSRSVGIAITLVTAAVVFGVGQAIVSSLKSKPAPPPIEVKAPPPPPPVAPPAPTLAVADAAAASDGAAADAAAADGMMAPAASVPATATAPAGDAASAVAPGATTATAAPPAPPTPGTPATAAVPPAAEPAPAPALEPAERAEEAAKSEPAKSESTGKSPEKDLAREAWRKNLPEISVEDSRATILIPIKGSAEGATYHVTKKPRAVNVLLPKAESLITMRFYPLKRDGFRNLWIKQDQSDGAALRLTLVSAGPPQVEIKDDYVRITVRKSDE